MPTVKPVYRKLRGYAFDPSFASTVGKRQTNEVIYKVRWEETSPGPCGAYVEVIDYDPSKECFYEAVDLDDKYVLADHGLPLSEGDPKFHQQQVYAVIMSVIAQFEKALGRKVIWSRVEETEQGGRFEFRHDFVEKLRVYPHALRQQNAFYSPQKVALLFGYFQASSTWSGTNVPRSAIFTCLSPDIVAHEVTHAILDSLHPYLRKDTNDDMLAFHEGFADIIALLQRFTFKPVVEEQIRNAKGDLLSSQNLLGDLAIQFGQAVSGNRRALRSFLIEKDAQGKEKLVEPDPGKYTSVTEVHDRGGLLVAAVFDAFVRLYKFRVADLIRLATDGSGKLGDDELDPDLVKRLSEEACEIANKLMLICIRALDYCPPVDLNFGDYLRALITADVEHNPEDEDGLRYALLESFRNWGIVPCDVNTYSVESLVWKPIEDIGMSKQVAALQKSIHFIFNTEINSIYRRGTHHNPDINIITARMEKILREEDRKIIFEETQELAKVVHSMFNNKFAYYMENLENLLGMSFRQNEYKFTDDLFKTEVKLKAWKRDKFQVYKCRPVIRHNSISGSTTKLLIITFLQKVYVDLKGSPYEGYFQNDQYDFRGGSTLIIDLSNFKILYVIRKGITSSERLKAHLAYALNRSNEEENAALLMQDSEPFAALHIH